MPLRARTLAQGLGIQSRIGMDQALGGRKHPQFAALFKKIRSKPRMQNEVPCLQLSNVSLRLR